VVRSAEVSRDRVRLATQGRTLRTLTGGLHAVGDYQLVKDGIENRYAGRSFAVRTGEPHTPIGLFPATINVFVNAMSVAYVHEGQAPIRKLTIQPMFGRAGLRCLPPVDSPSLSGGQPGPILGGTFSRAVLTCGQWLEPRADMGWNCEISLTGAGRGEQRQTPYSYKPTH
jgi:hypothetical protein